MRNGWGIQHWDIKRDSVSQWVRDKDSYWPGWGLAKISEHGPVEVRMKLKVVIKLQFSVNADDLSRSRWHSIYPQGVADFEWHPVVATNISHLNIGNQMEMDQGLPNHRWSGDCNVTISLPHRRVSFWQSLPVYWNSNRENYRPAPPPALQDNPDTHSEL